MHEQDRHRRRRDARNARRLTHGVRLRFRELLTHFRREPGDGGVIQIWRATRSPHCGAGDRSRPAGARCSRRTSRALPPARGSATAGDRRPAAAARRWRTATTPADRSLRAASRNPLPADAAARSRSCRGRAAPSARAAAIPRKPSAGCTRVRVRRSTSRSDSSCLLLEELPALVIDEAELAADRASGADPRCLRAGAGGARRGW